MEDIIKNLRFDERGLIPAIIQSSEDGEVLMMAYMNEESLRRTIETGNTHFWSRSRKRLWMKGETSGHIQKVDEILYDCDEDALLIKVRQLGKGACHTGHRSCFYRNIKGEETAKETFNAEEVYKKPILDAVYDVILDRKKNPREASYVSGLFRKGDKEIAKKVGEEAVEAVVAMNQDRNALIYELTDLWFHSMVLMVEKDIRLTDIYNELKARFGKSGLRE